MTDKGGVNFRVAQCTVNTLPIKGHPGDVEMEEESRNLTRTFIQNLMAEGDLLVLMNEVGSYQISLK